LGITSIVHSWLTTWTTWKGKIKVVRDQSVLLSSRYTASRTGQVTWKPCRKLRKRSIMQMTSPKYRTPCW